MDSGRRNRGNWRECPLRSSDSRGLVHPRRGGGEQSLKVGDGGKEFSRSLRSNGSGGSHDSGRIRDLHDGGRRGSVCQSDKASCHGGIGSIPFPGLFQKDIMVGGAQSSVSIDALETSAGSSMNFIDTWFATSCDSKPDMMSFVAPIKVSGANIMHPIKGAVDGSTALFSHDEMLDLGVLVVIPNGWNARTTMY
jgi:hypothetical protein